MFKLGKQETVTRKIGDIAQTKLDEVNHSLLGFVLHQGFVVDTFEKKSEDRLFLVDQGTVVLREKCMLEVGIVNFLEFKQTMGISACLSCLSSYTD